MSQTSQPAVSTDGLAAWAAATAQSRQTAPELAFPTHQIFAVVAYPFSRPVATPKHAEP